MLLGPTLKEISPDRETNMKYGKKQKYIQQDLKFLSTLACTEANVIQNNVNVHIQGMRLHNIIPKADKSLVKETSCEKQKSRCIRLGFHFSSHF
jgi:hypothetical protein